MVHGSIGVQGEWAAGRVGWLALPGVGRCFPEEVTSKRSQQGGVGERLSQRGAQRVQRPRGGDGQGGLVECLQLWVGSGPWGCCWSRVQRPGDVGHWALWR